MLKSHEKFHSANGKRQILIADDELINRELLRMVLQQDYELIFAENGREALEMIRRNCQILSLVLMDLKMPVMGGLDVLRHMREEPALSRIPVIVLTSDQDAEIESLSLGAIDFIPKPYPQAGVMQARILRTIELSEDRDIINSTERDPLTGLYNREFFYRYAEQFDQHHSGVAMDAIVVDVNHFHMINERFGTAYGDGVLRRIGEKAREVVQDTGGIVCRREADTFMIYCPHGKDYRAILDNATVGLAGDSSVNGRVRLRMGVYENVDKSLDIERRFDRAKMAADTVRGSFAKTIGVYDNALHEKELYSERLIEEFDRAIREKQFQVFYQPKFDVRPEIPFLSSAEALVRWFHPELGMISPGAFIPLFEENGLIQTLDHYVWEAAAAQIREWKERFGISIPVSVNVSRIDMYDPQLVEAIHEIVVRNGLEPSELLLEITESAYTQDSEQIIETVNRLRNLGFRIEMDDFGTGYSSLNMISTLPIDALKLDMQFIRNAFSGHRDTRMLEIIIDIADYLSVPVIAEGVETEDQLRALRTMGCDIVQGYYFSRPVPAQEYEKFVVERLDRGNTGAEADPHASAGGSGEDRPGEHRDVAFGGIATALSSGYESIYYINTLDDHYVQFSSEGKYEDLQIEDSGLNFFADAARNVARVVFYEDQERVGQALRKENLLARMEGAHPFSMNYRLMIDGEPVYYALKSVRARTKDDHHIVIGISNVDEQMRQLETSHPDHEEIPGREELVNELNFSSLARSLSTDMESIYYVDTETDTYLEFKTEGHYKKLELEMSGTDFFGECQRNIPQVVYVEDREKVSSALRRAALLSILRERYIFSMVYRLVIGGAPLYYRLKAVRADEPDDHHIIIGVSNIDAQITEEEKLEAQRQSSVTFSRIAEALSQDYFSIYYVNTETEHFIEYSAHEEYKSLGIETMGEDFFALSRKNIERVIYPEDRTRFLQIFTKEQLMEELADNHTFTLTYRLMFDGIPTYVRMKATRMADPSDPHIVIGVNNVNAEMQRRREMVTYASIAEALAADYFSIYYVDTDTDRFIEYSAHDEYRELGIEQGGEDFFNLSRRNIERVVHPDDVEMFLDAFTKEKILRELQQDKTFTLTYRLMFGDVPTYVHMKVTRMEDPADPHIVIGVSNIDEQMQREQEHSRAVRAINRDPLTGVKSKHAYSETEKEMDAAIAAGGAEPFAVVVCDLNDLKQVNDTQGHKAGDQYIKDGCMMVCRVFKHSPVFRIGGDEFAAILRGGDYEECAALMRTLAEKNRENCEKGKVTIACGKAEFRPGQDRSLAAVFERADAAMYENKKLLKDEKNG